MSEKIAIVIVLFVMGSIIGCDKAVDKREVSNGRIVLEIDKSGLKSSEIKHAQELSLEIIRNRAMQYGLSKSRAKAYFEGDNHIVAEFKGLNIDDAQTL